MASPAYRRRVATRRLFWRAICIGGVLAAYAVTLVDTRPTFAQGELMTFPPRPGSSKSGGIGLPKSGSLGQPGEQMLVRANEINYDHANDRVSAVGNVQIYFSGATLEADRVIYDQKTKRVHAEGNVRLLEPNGRVTYGEIINLSDDFRDGFVDSLRLDTPEQTRMAGARADRTGGNITVLTAGVYTACEACADDPRKPPKWQVKAARIIHDQGEQMIYFEDARLEFYGVPMAYIPFFSTPDPTAKRKTGFLIPTWGTSSRYGVSLTTPYYWALAPNYDFTLTPKFTTKQGPLVQGEWRHRLMNGSYTIRASGIFQLDPDAFSGTPGDRRWRGDVNTTGQFRINDRWVYGWDGTVITDKSYYQDYGFYKFASTDLLRSTPDYVASQAYLQGRGERSFFDLRAIYFYGFTSVDDQKQIPIVHPVLNHEYVFNRPVLGGELSLRSNLTSISRQDPAFDAITSAAVTGGWCTITSADPNARTANNCILRGVPGNYTRASTELAWRRTIVDPIGQCGRRSDRCAPTSQPSTSPARRAYPTSPPPGKTRWRGSCRPPASSTAIPSSMCSPGERRPSSRSPSSSSGRTKPISARCRTRIRKASCSTPRTCSAPTSSEAGIASRAADGSMWAASTPRSSTRAATSTSLLGSPIICSD